MIEKILAATDGSSHADKAVALASDLAARYRAHLMVLHVLPQGDATEAEIRLAKAEGLERDTAVQRVGRIEATPHGPHPLPTARHKEIDVSAARRLLGERIIAQAETIAGKAGVAVETVLDNGGDEADRILAVTRREQPDVLVLGSRGLGSLKGLVLGSVSHKVAKNAHCTCITVK